MGQLAQAQNIAGKIKENFQKRSSLDEFIETIKQKETPSSVTYPDNGFSKKLESAVKIMANNYDTKIISLGSSGLGD